MHGQSLKARDQSPFSKESSFTELLPETGAEHCCDFLAPVTYEVLFHDFSEVSSHSLQCGILWDAEYKALHRCIKKTAAQCLKRAQYESKGRIGWKRPSRPSYPTHHPTQSNQLISIQFNRLLIRIPDFQ